MQKEEITAKLVDIIRAAIDDPTVEADTIVNDITLDSLRFIKVVVTIEKTFKIKFDDENLLLHQYERIQDLSDYIESKMG